MEMQEVGTVKMSRNLLTRVLKGKIITIHRQSGSTTYALPLEIVEQIVDCVTDEPPAKQPQTMNLTTAAHPASVPPATGACPFMDLPSELRRVIFAESLPARDAVHHPKCDDDPPKIGEKKDKKSKPSGAVCLMLLNKKFCSEVAEILYEERQFGIHVHEGLQKGGIEFQNTGRQPLQYKDCVDDQRFWKFGNVDEFGFRRLKKIRVQICSAQEKECRHTAINTYFMNLALCRMLERSGEKKSRITSLTISFKEPKNGEQGYWFDPVKQTPRATSIHGISNIELVLRPFANLTGCHSVVVELPIDLERHVRMCRFVSDLEHSMKSMDGTMFLDDDLEMKIESARYAMEDYVNYTLHGTAYHEVTKLTDVDMQEPDEHRSDDDDDDDGDGGPLGGGQKARKHDLSPYSKRNASGNELKKKRQSDNDIHFSEDDNGNMQEWSDWRKSDEDTAWELSLEEQQKRESKMLAEEHDNRLFQEAINASLGLDAQAAQETPVDVDPSNDDVVTWLPPRQSAAAQQRSMASFEMPKSPQAAFANLGGAMSFQGKGRTLGSSASPQEVLGTRDSLMLIDLDDDEDSSTTRGSPPARRGRPAWNTNLHNHGQPSTTMTTRAQAILQQHIARNRSVTLDHESNQSSISRAPAAYMPNRQQAHTPSSTSSYWSTLAGSYTPTPISSSPTTAASYTPTPEYVPHPEAAEIVRQIDKYFGDDNLRQNPRLLALLTDGQGWVSLDEILESDKMRKFKPKSKVREAIRQSTVVEISADNKRLRRRYGLALLDGPSSYTPTPPIMFRPRTRSAYTPGPFMTYDTLTYPSQAPSSVQTSELVPSNNNVAHARYQPTVVGTQAGIEVIDMTGEDSGNEDSTNIGSTPIHVGGFTRLHGGTPHTTLSSPMRRLRSGLLGPIDEVGDEEDR